MLDEADELLKQDDFKPGDIIVSPAVTAAPIELRFRQEDEEYFLTYI